MIVIIKSITLISFPLLDETVPGVVDAVIGGVIFGVIPGVIGGVPGIISYFLIFFIMCWRIPNFTLCFSFTSIFRANN
jgi:hypothetical protein